MKPACEDIVLEIRGVHHGFGANGILHDINLKVARGEIVGLVGPSGCGKSTLLRAIVGTHPPRQGEIIVYPAANGGAEPEGKEVNGPGRDRGIVYQHYSLFPFLTAQENVAIGLMLDRTNLPFRFFRYPAWRRMRREHLAQAADFLEQVGLGHAAKLYPSSMSGGMCQRVAIAQALIMKPAVLLLDEPFGALDEATREELQTMLLTLYLENCQARKRGEPPPYTIIIVTHELNEAIYVGDRVVGVSQFWNWQAQGLAKCPGATIVYDRAAPVFLPDDERNFQLFAPQRAEIRRTVFDPEYNEDRIQYRTFWSQITEGKGQGIFAN